MRVKRIHTGIVKDEKYTDFHLYLKISRKDFKRLPIVNTYIGRRMKYAHLDDNAIIFFYQDRRHLLILKQQYLRNGFKYEA